MYASFGTPCNKPFGSVIGFMIHCQIEFWDFSEHFFKNSKSIRFWNISEATWVFLSKFSFQGLPLFCSPEWDVLPFPPQWKSATIGLLCETENDGASPNEEDMEGAKEPEGQSNRKLVWLPLAHNERRSFGSGLMLTCRRKTVFESVQRRVRV